MSAHRRAICAALLALVALLMAACSPFQSGGATTSGGPPSTQDAAVGRGLFAANCAACHGAGGEGQPDWHVRRADGTLPAPPLNGDGHTWHHGDGLLYRVVSQGGEIFEDPNVPSFKSGMPAFGDRLSHEEIVAVLTYVKSLWRDKTSRGLLIREHQASVSEEDPFPPGGG